jgi:anti-sigma factor RsiW
MVRFSCRQCRTYLTAYIHNELTPRARRRIDAHLNTCTVCASIYMEQSRAARDLSFIVGRIGQPNGDRLHHIWHAVQSEIGTPSHVSARRKMRPPKLSIQHGAVVVVLVMTMLMPTVLRGTQAAAQLPDPPTPTRERSRASQQITHSASALVMALPAIATEQALTHPRERDANTPRIDLQPNYAPTPGATDSPQ